MKSRLSIEDCARLTPSAEDILKRETIPANNFKSLRLTYQLCKPAEERQLCVDADWWRQKPLLSGQLLQRRPPFLFGRCKGSHVALRRPGTSHNIHLQLPIMLPKLLLCFPKYWAGFCKTQLAKSREELREQFLKIMRSTSENFDACP